MQRRRLTNALASLGLLGLSGSSAACKPAECPCEAEPPTAKPEPEVELGDGEPSGLRGVAKPALTLTTTTEPRFDTIPAQFCAASIEPRNQPLVLTASFLEAWNELAPPVRNRLAVNIPATEIDARMMLCASPQCTIDVDRVAEVTADYMVGVGAVLPSDGRLLVIPELAPPHSNNPCSNTSTIEVARAGRFIHVKALNQTRRYSYSHGHHGYGYYAPSSCELYELQRRDLIIDAVSFELELIITQDQASAQNGWVELSIEAPGIILRGCDSALELRWTQ